MANRQATHRDPIWRDRADFIIAVDIDPGGTDITSEQLWARRIDERHFELCCIPFFAYDLSLGDVVEVGADYHVKRVSKASGRYVFRVHVPPERSESRDDIVTGLAARGALVEWSSPKMFAVDVSDAMQAQLVADYLTAEEQAGHLEYETGRTT